MTSLVADTSGLVSLGTVDRPEPTPLELCVRTYDLLIPERVVAELHDVASHDDTHGKAASRLVDELDRVRTKSVKLDETFPLGENAAVTLANNHNAAVFLCDEFTRLGLTHASLADTRLVTTPTLLSIFVRRGLVSSSEAVDHLDRISDARSWNANSYVQRARSLLNDQ